MTMRLRALRLAIFVGYAAVGFGVGFSVFGAYVIPIAALGVAFAEPIVGWINGDVRRAQVRTQVLAVGRDALESDQMDFMLKDQRGVIVIDDDPKWGRLVEGRDTVHGGPLVAVQVTNSTAEPDGTFKKVWLRVPARGDRQGTRVCMRKNCGVDIAWPPRTAREAIAWTFRLCVEHYKPAKAS